MSTYDIDISVTYADGAGATRSYRRRCAINTAITIALDEFIDGEMDHGRSDPQQINLTVREDFGPEVSD